MHGIFDSHAHYHDQRFDADREELLGSMPEKGIAYILEAGVDLDCSREIAGLAERYDFLWCAAGIHPHEAKDAPEDMERRLAELAGHHKVCALGEMGLDYHYDFSPRQRQREIFRRQLELARELQLPVIVHDREAHQDTLELLKKYRPKGVVHCYSGSSEMVKEITALGMYLGFTGAVTFQNAHKPLEAAAAVPEDRLLVETDCPYMAPHPFRGKRCDSSMLPQVLTVLADVRGMEPQALADITCANARRLFGVGKTGR